MKTTQLAVAFCAVILCGGTLSAFAAEGDQPSPERDKDKVCTRCHDENDDKPVFSIYRTRHGLKADERTPSCQSCHGESLDHIKNPKGVTPRPTPDVVFARTSKSRSAPEAQNTACLTCHSGGARIQWPGSVHERTDQACTNCHTIHAPKDPVLVQQTQAGVCFSCHKDKRAEIMRFSSHPIRTGAVTCSSCHLPHGSPGEFLLARFSVNETCYTCHADKRGPFLWEHPPVREDCTNCHNPHGTSNSAMLKQRPPQLCQNCHENQFHPSTAYSGNNLPPFPPLGTPSGDKMLGQSCVNCHSRIHGSNHPSGARFTR